MAVTKLIDLILLSAFLVADEAIVHLSFAAHIVMCRLGMKGLLMFLYKMTDGTDA